MLGRVRPDAEAVGATQFEVLTAAALAEFADGEVDVAVVEAGLGGRHDATNVLDAPVVVLTNVSFEHTDVLGATREEIAAEKLAVVRPGAQIVLGEPEWEEAARAAGAAGVSVVAGSSDVLAHAAVECFLGRTVDPAPLEEVVVPGRLERVGDTPLEIWDGAHNPAGVGYLLTRVPRADWVLVASILADKDASGMLAALSALGRRLVATSSSSPRALPAEELARVARPFFADVARGGRSLRRPVPRARAGGRRRCAPRHRLPLPARGPGLRPPYVSTMASVGERLSVYVLAAVVLFAIVAIAFGAGWLVGKILL